MKWSIPFIILISLSNVIIASPLNLKDGDKVIFVGGTFFEREAEKALIETYLTITHRDKTIQFRNLAWSADTVKGESRGYYEAHKGYENLLSKVQQAEGSLIILSYGANEAWSGPQGLSSFIENYRKLIKDLQTQSKSRIVLMSSPRQENLGGAYPNADSYNKNLQSYFSAVADLAQELNLEYVDLFSQMPNMKGLTSNSIHLNEAGYRRVAEILSGLTKSNKNKLVSAKFPTGFYQIQVNGQNLLKSHSTSIEKNLNDPYLNLNERLLQKLIREKNEHFFHAWRPQNMTYLFGFRKHEQGQNGKEVKEFAQYIRDYEKQITQIKQLDAKTINYQVVAQPQTLAKTKAQADSLILPPEEEIKTFNLADDLEVNLFAAEPMVINPTNMNWDNKGRLWVACTPGYPQIKPGHLASDQIVVLEDSNGDGQADKHHVFVDNVLIPTAVLHGNGGVYVANSTEFVHYKDTDGDMKADEKKVILSGFGTEDTHHIIHTPYWGQDGLLYFSQSIYINSHVETPWGVKRLMKGGLWQYNPQTEQLKVFARGLINPWGLSMDKYGRSFATDGAGSHGINYLFPDVAQVTAHGTSHLYPGLNPGQPKHCGLEIISGDHFPEKYQNLLITNDFRGHRTNSFKLTENGSAFISTQQNDLISTGSGKIDRHGKGGGFRPVDVRMGPDGALYIADWSNIIIQHGEVDFRDQRRDQSHGRIWRITVKDRALAKKFDFHQASLERLLQNLASKNRYLIDMSKRELIERKDPKIEPAIAQFLSKKQNDYTKLQVLWLRVGLNAPDQKLLQELVLSQDKGIRAAAIRVAAQQYNNNSGIIEIYRKSIHDPAPIVRLESIHALRDLGSTQAIEIALHALDHELDKTIDYALVLSVKEKADQWIGKSDFNGNSNHLLYAVKASNNPKALGALYKAYKQGEISHEHRVKTLQLIGELGKREQLTELFESALDANTPLNEKKVILSSLLRSSQRRNIRPAAQLTQLSALFQHLELQNELLALVGEWRLKQLVNKLEPSAKRGHQGSFDSLARIKSPESEALLLEIIQTNEGKQIAVQALAALAAINLDKATALSVKSFKQSAKDVDYGPVYETILKDQNGPKSLELALQGKTIDPSIALLGVQRANMVGRDLSSLISALNKAGQLKAMKQNLSPEELSAMVLAVKEKGNPQLGEIIYRKESIACIACHAIGGVGPEIGPDLISIGASAPIDYLIESILQPSKKIKEGYHMTMVMTKDGKMIAGSQVTANKQEVIIRDALGKLTKIPSRNIKSKNMNPMSMMPPGLASSLSEEEFIHLISFLSELGKDGDFKMSKQAYVRNFESSDTELDKRIWSQLPKLSFKKAYAKVNGELPINDKAILKNGTGTLKFKINVLKEGILTLNFSTLENLDTYKVSREKFNIDKDNNTASIKMNKGESEIIVVLKKGFAKDSLTVKIDKSTALVELK